MTLAAFAISTSTAFPTVLAINCGEKVMKHRNRRHSAVQPLKVREQRTLEHVVRFRLTTVEVLNRAVLTGDSPNAIAKLVNRLCHQSYLIKHTLIHPTRYYVLGLDGARRLGLTHHRVPSFGPQSLPIEYCVLLYALMGQHQRIRLNRAEVLRWCPWLQPSLAAAPHCADLEKQILELIRVDLGGAATHVARKCVGDITKRRKSRKFSHFVAEGRFRLVVITSTPEKSRAVRQALQAHEWPPGMLVHISVIPQLLALSTR
jgi:hypothetical protein